MAFRWLTRSAESNFCNIAATSVLGLMPIVGALAIKQSYLSD